MGIERAAATYTVRVDGADWPVYHGTHRIHYRCKHDVAAGTVHIVAWSDWNKPEEIPPHPACDALLENCGAKAIVGGCHQLHEHRDGPQPKGVESGR